jgi:hypothetical protein
MRTVTTNPDGSTVTTTRCDWCDSTCTESSRGPRYTPHIRKCDGCEKHACYAHLEPFDELGFDEAEFFICPDCEPVYQEADEHAKTVRSGQPSYSRLVRAYVAEARAADDQPISRDVDLAHAPLLALAPEMARAIVRWADMDAISPSDDFNGDFPELAEELRPILARIAEQERAEDSASV